MLHSVVVDGEALAALDTLFAITGTRIPRSAPVAHGAGVASRAHCGRTWHAIPIDQATIIAVQRLRRTPDEPFNDSLRTMLDLPPLATASQSASKRAQRHNRGHQPATFEDRQILVDAQWRIDQVGAVVGQG